MIDLGKFKEVRAAVLNFKLKFPLRGMTMRDIYVFRKRSVFQIQLYAHFQYYSTIKDQLYFKRKQDSL